MNSSRRLKSAFIVKSCTGSTSPVIGIDLGTSYFRVAVFRNGKVEVIPNNLKQKSTPSCVAFTESEILFGEEAKNYALRDPKNTVFNVKRIIGRRFDDPELQSDMKHWLFEIISDEDKKPVIRVRDEKSYNSEKVFSMLLLKMKEMAEAYMGVQVKGAVVAVPACFNDSQRQAVRDAGAIAGLNVLRIIEEPTAAAITYGMECNGKRNILSFDLGGGSLDVSVLTVCDGTVHVKSTAGNSNLGGIDFDNRLVAFCCEEFEQKHKQKLTSNPQALCRLQDSCEKVKHTLSSYNQTSILLNSLHDGIHYHTIITRSQFEDLCEDLFKEILSVAEKAVSDPTEVDDIVLVGGSSRIPKIQKLLSEFFNGEELKTLNPDEAVVSGAAILAGTS